MLRGGDALPSCISRTKNPTLVSPRSDDAGTALVSIDDAAPVVIRDATIEDMDQVLAIYAHYVTLDNDVTTFEEQVPSLEEMQRRFTKVTTSGFPFLVAEQSRPLRRVLGYTYSNTYRSRSAYRFTAETSIYVADDRRGQGLGTTLLAALLERLRAAGQTRQVIAVLGTEADNPGSFHLHRKFGFTVAGHFTGIGRKHGRWVDRVHMQLELPEYTEGA